MIAMVFIAFFSFFFLLLPYSDFTVLDEMVQWVIYYICTKNVCKVNTSLSYFSCIIYSHQGYPDGSNFIARMLKSLEVLQLIATNYTFATYHIVDFNSPKVANGIKVLVESNNSG